MMVMTMSMDEKETGKENRRADERGAATTTATEKTQWQGDQAEA